MTPEAARGRWQFAVGWVSFVGVVNAVLGLVSVFSSDPELQTIGGGPIGIVIGILFLVLGVFAARRSKSALGIAVALGVLNAILGIFFGDFQAILSGGLLVFFAMRGIGAIEELPRPATAAAARARLSTIQPISLRSQSGEQWQNVLTPEQSATPLMLRFSTRPVDFQSGGYDFSIVDLSLELVWAQPHSPLDFQIRYLHFTPQASMQPLGGPATSTGSTVRTDRGASSWLPIIGQTPFGDWELALADTEEMRRLFSGGAVADIQLTLSCSYSAQPSGLAAPFPPSAASAPASAMAAQSAGSQPLSVATARSTARSGWATASLVCSLIPVIQPVGALLGIVFGIQALRQIKRSGGGVKGHGLALAGIIAGGAMLALSAGLIVLLVMTMPFPSQ